MKYYFHLIDLVVKIFFLNDLHQYIEIQLGA
jgi:hypothetical protein